MLARVLKPYTPFAFKVAKHFDLVSGLLVLCCSMPENKDSLGLECLFSLDDVLDPIFSVVVDFSP